jgi:tRNA 2-thiouridine synthesizing protein A
MVPARLDLIGVKCPLSWAKAKVRLRELSRGDLLELVVGEERAVRDIPRAAEAEGHAVIDVTRDGPPWRILIEC